MLSYLEMLISLYLLSTFWSEWSFSLIHSSMAFIFIFAFFIHNNRLIFNRVIDYSTCFNRIGNIGIYIVVSLIKYVNTFFPISFWSFTFVIKLVVSIVIYGDSLRISINSSFRFLLLVVALSKYLMLDTKIVFEIKRTFWDDIVGNCKC